MASLASAKACHSSKKLTLEIVAIEDAQAIFTALDGAQGKIGLAEFITLDLFLAAYTVYGVEELAAWVRKEYGSVSSAFMTINTKGTGEMCLEEFEKAIESKGHPNKHFATQCLRFLSAERSTQVSKSAFQSVEYFSAHFFMTHLEGFMSWLEESYGDTGWAFDAMTTDPSTGELVLDEFRRAVSSACPFASDKPAWASGCGIKEPAQALFNFLDHQATGKISKQDWTTMLNCFKVEAAHDGIITVARQLEKEFGNFDLMYQAIVAARPKGQAETCSTLAASNVEHLVLDSLYWTCSLCGERCGLCTL